MLKGKGQIDYRIPFGPYVISSLIKGITLQEQPVLLLEMNLLDLTVLNFSIMMNFRNIFLKIKTLLWYLIFCGTGQHLNIAVTTYSSWFDWDRKNRIT